MLCDPFISGSNPEEWNLGTTNCKVLVEEYNLFSPERNDKTCFSIKY